MNFFPLPANLAVWVSLPVGEESIYVYAYITVGRIAQTHGSIIFGRDFHICGAHQAMAHSF